MDTIKKIKLVVFLSMLGVIQNQSSFELSNFFQKPSTYVGLAGLLGTGKILSNMTGSNFIGYTLPIGAFLGLQLSQIPSWFKLRSLYFKLVSQNTNEIDPAKRTIWKNPFNQRNLLDGFEIMNFFNRCSIQEKKTFKHSLMSQISAGNEISAINLLIKGMNDLKQQLDMLSDYTNLQYVITYKLGLKGSPNELLTSDVLIDNEAVWDMPIDDALESDVYPIGSQWSEKYHMSYMTYYHWTYALANKCVRLLLRQYSILKAFKRIMEYVVPGQESLGTINMYVSTP